MIPGLSPSFYKLRAREVKDLPVSTWLVPEAILHIQEQQTTHSVTLYQKATGCKNPNERGPGGAHISRYTFCYIIFKTIPESKQKFYLGAVPTYLFFLWNMEIEMRYFNHKEQMSIFYLLSWTCWTQSATSPLHGVDLLFYGWRRERQFLQHSPQCLLQIKNVANKKQMWI